MATGAEVVVILQCVLTTQITIIIMIYLNRAIVYEVQTYGEELLMKEASSKLQKLLLNY